MIKPLYGFCGGCGQERKKLLLREGQWRCLSCVSPKAAKA